MNTRAPDGANKQNANLRHNHYHDFSDILGQTTALPF